jgi:NAD(P)-dependent dehydrogenase (short-subunit alcohol dehydrogenase family)
LGLAIAKKLVADGVKVLMVDCDPVVEERTSGAGFPRGMAFAKVKDLADEDAAPVVFQAALAALGNVDTLVNNAAWSLHKLMSDMAMPEFNRLVAINQRAPFFLAQEFLRYIAGLPTKPKDPAIINITSTTALAGSAYLVAYGGTKSALEAMTRAMAVEMAPLGIRVNGICPCRVDTPMLRKVIAERNLDPKTLFDDFLIKRSATCEEVAELVAFLCGPAAACVDGANWAIDGGFLAR